MKHFDVIVVQSRAYRQGLMGNEKVEWVITRRLQSPWDIRPLIILFNNLPSMLDGHGSDCL